jgi:ribonucleoside-diphosphate reductase alpha chain
VLEFVRLKTTRDDIVHFNLSVNLTTSFMSALERGASFRLRDGREHAASAIWEEIVDAAWASGDPGVMFLSRFNADNPTPRLAEYTTTAPCAEVALAPGEACIFGYVNVDAFGDSRGGVDHQGVAEAAAVLTRVLDDAVETSLSEYPGDRSRWIMGAKRKIGIGICGYADLLVRLGLPYASAPSLEILRDLLLTITLHSKLASVELAAARGPFPAFALSTLQRPAFRKKYGELESSIVTRADWDTLDRQIARWGIRNATTTALPPSGRSAILLGASTSIEPWFTLRANGGKAKKKIVDALRDAPEDAADAALSAIASTGSVQDCAALPERTRLVLRRAAELQTSEHLAVVAQAGRCLDDGASKTINLRAAAPRAEVDFAFREAWRLGLKAVSVYRDGCRADQPESLVQ